MYKDISKHKWGHTQFYIIIYAGMNTCRMKFERTHTQSAHPLMSGQVNIQAGKHKLTVSLKKSFWIYLKTIKLYHINILQPTSQTARPARRPVVFHDES